MHGRIGVVFLVGFIGAVTFAGCDDPPLKTYFEDEQPPVAAAVAPAGAFDPSSVGSIAGRVTWEGKAPSVPPFHAPVSPLSEQPFRPKRFWANPHAPVIDAKTGGVAGAVVFLRGVDADAEVAAGRCRGHHDAMTLP